MRYCTKCPITNLTDQETDDQYSNNIQSIFFHIYHIIACCTAHGRLRLNNKEFFRKCTENSDSEQSTNVH